MRITQWISDCVRPPEASAALAQEIRTRQFRAALQLIPFTSTTNVGIAIATAWFYHHLVPPFAATIWALLVVAVEIDSIRSFRLSKMLTRPVQCADLRRLAWQSATVATLLAMAVIALLPQLDAENRLLVATVTAGMIGAGAFVLAPVPMAGLLWTGCLGLGASIALLLIQAPVYFVILIMLLIYSALMAVTVLLNSRLFIANVRAEVRAEQQGQVVGLLLKDFEGSARDWLWETDPAGRLNLVSIRLAEAFGRDVASLSGAPLLGLLRDTFPSPSRSESQALDLLQLRFDSQRAFRDQVVPVMVGGDLRWWALTAKPLLDSQGQFLRLARRRLGHHGNPAPRYGDDAFGEFRFADGFSKSAPIPSLPRGGAAARRATSAVVVAGVGLGQFQSGERFPRPLDGRSNAA